MVKVDLITGFLGSGKTTFIKKYARYLMDQGYNIGILENDFGAVNVDMMLLRELEGEQCELEMVAGGCDKDCHRRRFKTKLIAMGMYGYDRVLIEPSGIFDMDEFFDALHEEPLDRWYQIGNVIAVVDAGLDEKMSEEAVSQGAIHKPEIDPAVPYERYIFWLREDLSRPELNTCFQKANDRSFNLVRLDSALQERLKDLLPEIEQSLRGDQFGDNFLSEALFTQFMVYINRIFLKSSTAPDRKSYSSDSQVEQLLKYINRNLAEDLSIDSLAGKFFFSKYHMMRKFKEETGYTIHNYIVSKRLLHARSLVSQGTPIMKAAQMSGFRDYTTFVRAYKKQFGTVPTQR